MSYWRLGARVARVRQHHARCVVSALETDAVVLHHRLERVVRRRTHVGVRARVVAQVRREVEMRSGERDLRVDLGRAELPAEALEYNAQRGR